jgi:bifunctional UDP-N-acetylglucosamine pyrophosphorylase/glucosamine-1-phosphate N-acetyltransferase
MPSFSYIKYKDSKGFESLSKARPITDFPLANRPFSVHQQLALAAAGLRLTENAELKVHPLAWIDANEINAFLDDASAGEWLDDKGNTLATNTSRGKKKVHATKSFLLQYSWDLIRANEYAVAAHDSWVNHGQAHASLYIDGKLSVGRGTKILPGVVIEGDVVIGENCKVGPNCYIRGSTSIGNNCHIGQAVEIKNTIILNQTNIGHLSYVGDSVIGEKVNFGAGTITSNLRHDGKTMHSMVGKELVDTGRRKFGAIVGDGVHTGIHTSIYPGRKIWPEQSTKPGDVVAKDLT